MEGMQQPVTAHLSHWSKTDEQSDFNLNYALGMAGHHNLQFVGVPTFAVAVSSRERARL